MAQPPFPHWGFDDEQWASIKARYWAGATVTGTISRISTSNRWYTVHFDDVWARVTWLRTPPATGMTTHYTVSRLLDSTHRIILTAQDTASR